MSKSIDERVVQLQFDNQDFEKNAKTSLGTLDRLKSSLDILGTGEALKGIGNIDTSSFNELESEVDNAGRKFNWLEEVAVGCFRRIGEAVTDFTFGKLKAFTIEPIMAGWDKYAEKTRSVQTIMAATATAIPDTAERMELVTEQLEKLNWYTDETSFKFTDMTDNIGKFTSAGVRLQDATQAMMGITNWAGLSGATAEQASHAMYNLAQAMGSNVVRLQDWKSIENANMSTIEFKNTVLETAESMGVLRRVSDDMWETIDGETQITAKDFNDSLKYKWFTGEVLTESLSKFSGFTEAMYSYSDSVGDYYDTTSEFMDAIDEYIETGSIQDLDDMLAYFADSNVPVTAQDIKAAFEDLADPTYELGRRAFRASQEAITLQDALDSVGDAASTTWMRIWEALFGNYEQSKVLWTDLANTLWAVFVGPLDEFTQIIEMWSKMGGNAYMIEGVVNIFRIFATVVGALTTAFKELFIGETGHEKVIKDIAGALTDGSKAFRDFTAFILKLVEGVMPALTMAFKVLLVPVKIVFEVVKYLVTTFYNLATSMADSIQSSEHVQRIFTALSKIGGQLSILFYNLGNKWDAFLRVFKKTEAFQKFADLLNPIITSIQNFAGNTIGRAIESFTQFIEALSLEGVDIDVTEVASQLNDWLLKIYDGAAAAAGVLTEFGTALSNAFSNVKENGISLTSLSDAFESAKKKIKDFFQGIKDLFTPNGNDNILTKAEELFGKIGSTIKTALSNLDVSDVLNAAKVGTLAWIVWQVLSLVKKFKDAASDLADIPGAFVDVLESAKKALNAYQANLNADTILKVAESIGILALSLVALSFIPAEELSKAVGAMIILTGALVILTKAATAFKDAGPENEAAAAVEKFSKTMGKALKRFATFFGIAAIITSIAIAIGVLTVCVKVLAKIPWQEAMTAVAEIAIMMGVLTACVAGLSLIKTQIGLGTVAAIVVFSNAILKLAIAINLLRGITAGPIIAVVVVMAALAGAVFALGATGPGALAASAALFVLSTALIAISGAAVLIGMFMDQAAQGLSLMGIALFGLVGAGAIAMLVSEGLIAIAVAAVGFGAGALMIGGGLFLIAKACEVLTKILPDIVDALMDFLRDLADAGPELLVILTELGGIIIAAFLNLIPMFCAAILYAIEVVLDFIVSFMDPLGMKIVALLAQLCADVADGIVALTDIIWPAIKMLLDSIMYMLLQGIVELLDPILLKIPGVGQEASALLHATVGDFADGFKQGVDENKERMSAAADELMGAADARLAEATGPIKETVSKVMGGVGEGIDESLPGLEEKASNAGGRVSGKVAEGFESNRDLVMSGANGMPTDVINTMSGGLDSGQDKVRIAAANLSTKALEGLNESTGDFLSTGSTQSGSYNEGLMSIMTSLGTTGTAMGASPIDAIGMFTGQWGLTGTEQATSYNTSLDAQRPAITTTTETIAKESCQELEDKVDDYGKAGKESGTEYDTELKNKKPDVVNTANEIAQEASNKVKEYKTEYETAGKDSGEGFASGLRSKLDAVCSAAGALASGALNRLKGLLGIASPSKEFAWAGNMSGLGFENGLNSRADRIYNASSGLAQAALAGIKDYLGSDEIENDLNFNPVITPVLNLDAVRSGAEAMNGLIGSPAFGAYGMGRIGVSGYSRGVSNTNNYGGVTIYVTGNDNASASDIADEVINRINIEYQRQKAAWV